MSSMKLLQAHQLVVKQRQTNKLTKIHCQILLVQRITIFFYGSETTSRQAN